MPTAKEHFSYTVNEWSNDPFTKILEKLPEIKVFYDIGANVGGVTYVLKNKYPKLKAFCFEPVEVNFNELVQNVPFATCIQKGIYYGETKSKVMWRGSNEGAFFVEHINAGEPRVDHGDTIDLIELESIKLPKPDLIKLDVEGAEENIIEHSKLIKKCPYLIVEWHPDHVDPIQFFEKHLNHKILLNIENKQFLLCLK